MLRVRYAILPLVLACTSPKSAGSPDATTAAATVDASPKAAPAADEDVIKAAQRDGERAVTLLSGWVRPGASDPTVPWALAHGLVAFGPSLTIPDGRLAIDFLVNEYAERVKLAGGDRYTFPEETFAGEPLEPHPNLILKTLLEIGVPKDHVFNIKGVGKVTLDQMVAQLASIVAIPTDDTGWRKIPWTVSALFHALQPLDVIGTDAKRPVQLLELGTATMAYLESQQKFIDDLMVAAKPEGLEKKRQLIFAHACGGMHLVQAALFAASKLQEPMLLGRARRQLDILAFRFVAEREIYENSLKSAPEYALLLKIQEMKFYGHLLETLAFAVKWQIIPATPQLKSSVAEMVGQLSLTVGQLQAAYQDLGTVRAKNKQAYLDLIGDGCHAIRGLRESIVAILAAP